MADTLPDTKSLQKETLIKRNILENSILIHGLRGDNTLEMRHDESEILKQILESGYITSPSKRTLIEQELIRYSGRKSHDFNCVFFDVLNEQNTSHYTRHYIGSVLFVFPVDILVGKVVAEDPFDTRQIDTIKAFENEGVKIPIDKGFMFIGQGAWEKNKELIRNCPNLRIGIVPEDNFNRPNQILHDAKKKVPVFNWVGYNIISKNEQNEFMEVHGNEELDPLLKTKNKFTSDDLI